MSMFDNDPRDPDSHNRHAGISDREEDCPVLGRGPGSASAHEDGADREGAWSRVRYAAIRANVPTGVHILRHHVLLAPGHAGCGNAGGAGTGGSPRFDDDSAVFAPEPGSVGRHHSIAGIESGRVRAWRNTGDGRRPRSKVESLERVKWLGGRDSNPDKQSQSLLSYR